MKPIVRKLRGAQRVASLQADVVRLHAYAQRLHELEEQARGAKEKSFRHSMPEEDAVTTAHSDFHHAIRLLHEASPKRAVAVAAKLGLVRDTWAGFPKYTGKHRYPAYRNINRYPDTLSASVLPVDDQKSQRKLRKIVEAQKQSKLAQKRKERET